MTNLTIAIVLVGIQFGLLYFSYESGAARERDKATLAATKQEAKQAAAVEVIKLDEDIRRMKSEKAIRKMEAVKTKCSVNPMPRAFVRGMQSVD